MGGLREVPLRTDIIHRMQPEVIRLELSQAWHMGTVQIAQLEQQFATRQHLSYELESTLIKHRQVELELDRQGLVEVELRTELLNEVTAHDPDKRWLLRLLRWRLSLARRLIHMLATGFTRLLFKGPLVADYVGWFALLFKFIAVFFKS